VIAKAIGACRPAPIEPHACVEGDHAVVIGQQRIDVELGELRQVGEHLRERDEDIADASSRAGGWSRNRRAAVRRVSARRARGRARD
jgi:hypothetical protein